MTRRSLIQKICPSCKDAYETTDSRRIFCSRQCAARYNNTGRKPTEEHKKKVGESLSRLYAKQPSLIQRGHKHALAVAKYTRGRHNKNPKHIFNMSKRTTSKILRRLAIGCSFCGWDKALGDIHHIEGRKISDPHNHKRLSYLCPNCHRLVESGKIDTKELMTFEEQVGDKWLEFYYG